MRKKPCPRSGTCQVPPIRSWISSLTASSASASQIGTNQKASTRSICQATFLQMVAEEERGTMKRIQLETKMKKVELKFNDKCCSNRLYKRAVAKGVISLGSHTEQFVSSLSTWSKRQYRLNWIINLNRVLRNKASAIICDWQPLMNHRHCSSVCGLFKFYPLPKGVVAMQMQYIWQDNQNKYPLNKPSLSFCESIKLGPYKTHNRFGAKYKEWRVSLKQVHGLLESVLRDMDE